MDGAGARLTNPVQTAHTKLAAAWLAVVGVAVLFAPAALATPQTFRITGGEIVATGSSGGIFLTDPVELPANGESITIDLTPGSEQILSLTIVGSGPVEVSLTMPLGGFDTLRVEALRLTGGPGQLSPIGAIPPDFEYAALIDDFVLDADFVLIDNMVAGPPEMLTIPLGHGTGTLFVSLAGHDLSLTGVVTNVFDHPDFGPITVKADINFSAVLIPEPSGAITFAVGLLPIARMVRRGRTRS